MIKHIQHMLPPQWAVLLAALLTLLQPSFAQSPAVSCDRGNYTVVFVNGVWNDEPEDVAISLFDLRNRVGAGMRKGFGWPRRVLAWITHGFGQDSTRSILRSAVKH